MENRFLSRGKRIDNGEWVQGVPSYGEDGKIEEIEVWDGEDITFYSVFPGTICQCTGLKDKNGNLIWENDIVRVTINSGSTICRCAFADTVAQFQLWQEQTIKRTSTVLNLGNYECEVIGNIFDNPELLESEE